MRYITRTDLLIVAKNSGYLMIGIGAMCLVPLIFDLVYFEFDILSFVIPCVISVLLGYGLLKYLEDKTKKSIQLKHGMMISSFAWLWASIIGGLVYMLATHMPPLDAVFESMSALSGTGITMFNDVEILPHSILFFRALEQWTGGLGVVVMVIGIFSYITFTEKLKNTDSNISEYNLNSVSGGLLDEKI